MCCGVSTGPVSARQRLLQLERSVYTPWWDTSRTQFSNSGVYKLHIVRMSSVMRDNCSLRGLAARGVSSSKNSRQVQQLKHKVRSHTHTIGDSKFVGEAVSNEELKEFSILGTVHCKGRGNAPVRMRCKFGSCASRLEGAYRLCRARAILDHMNLCHKTDAVEREFLQCMQLYKCDKCNAFVRIHGRKYHDDRHCGVQQLQDECERSATSTGGDFTCDMGACLAKKVSFDTVGKLRKHYNQLHHKTGMVPSRHVQSACGFVPCPHGCGKWLTPWE